MCVLLRSGWVCCELKVRGYVGVDDFRGETHVEGARLVDYITSGRELTVKVSSI